MSPWVDVGVGSHGHAQKYESRENDDFLHVPQTILKAIGQNKSMELLGYSFHNKNGPPDPPSPASGFVSGFPGTSVGNLSRLKDQPAANL